MDKRRLRSGRDDSLYADSRHHGDDGDEHVDERDFTIGLGEPAHRSLLRLAGDDEQDFCDGHSAIEFGWPELPLVKDVENRGRLDELGREDDFELLEAAVIVHEAMQDERIGIELAGIDVGADYFVGPGSIEMAAEIGCGIDDTR